MFILIFFLSVVLKAQPFFITLLKEFGALFLFATMLQTKQKNVMEISLWVYEKNVSEG